MVKPEDVSQEAWGAAVNAHDTIPVGGMQLRHHRIENIARAIQAAEKRGEERERDACNALLMFASEDRQALRLALGEMSAQEMRTLVAGIQYLAAAIRKRQENSHG